MSTVQHYATLGELEGHVGHVQALLHASSLFRASCTAHRFEQLRKCQQLHADQPDADQQAACAAQAHAFLTEANAAASSCAEQLFQQAQGECSKSFRALATCTAAHDGLLRPCAAHLEKLALCVEKHLPE